ncbi:LysE family translocator [Parathalassolituus penaei]|uniref:LysE family translocator n=1 Tax=Parathalassolituus penaei TaxID=2997323 RepID=A0A9X3EE23_9GAMM|nr:LysE family translocator [Parathalassolituus penaei]MCY0965882.1 LysE family translocator [Parathalassolituus penaei]
MLGIHDLTLYVISAFLLSLTPGPDSLLVMSRSAMLGVRAGLVAMLGICTGCLVHVVAATLGLSAILASSATAFMLVKLLGAAYLVYMGVMALRTRLSDEEASAPSAEEATASLWGTFQQGFWSNALNPKVALFFLAFVPQFVDPGSAHSSLAFLLLGLTYIAVCLLYFSGLTVLTATASQKLKVSRMASVWLNRTVGALFVGLGLRLALSARG